MREMVRFAPGIVKTAGDADMLIRYRLDRVRYDKRSLHAGRDRGHVHAMPRHRPDRMTIFAVDNP